jgi:hypothetical protein
MHSDALMLKAKGGAPAEMLKDVKCKIYCMRYFLELLEKKREAVVGK